METLRTYLREHGKTQSWLASELAVRPATVTAWMAGTMPKPHHMAAIAKLTEGAVPVTAWFSEAA